MTAEDTQAAPPATAPPPPAPLTPEEEQQKREMAVLWNFLRSPRAIRRKMFRRYLKVHGVPKPIFQTVREALTFKRLNYFTFLEDLKNAGKKNA